MIALSKNTLEDGLTFRRKYIYNKEQLKALDEARLSTMQMHFLSAKLISRSIDNFKSRFGLDWCE